MLNQVQLIVYVDRLGGGTVTDLRALLTDSLKGMFGGVHLLPFFYPFDGADAGFDPIDHTRVDDRLGTWADIKALSQEVPVMADVIVNHISAESPQFQDYRLHGSASKHAPLFLTLESVFPDGATEEDLLAVYRPRPGLPLTTVKLFGGQKRLLWTTFAPQQIDIDVESPEGRGYLRTILQSLAGAGVSMVRLDAVGYAIKRAGSSCFMTPETYAFIDEFAAEARGQGLEVLVEVHAYYQRQIEIAARVDRVYDFALPPLLLHAFAFKTIGPLSDWIARRPRNAVNVLDTHDGIGIIDIGPDPADPVRFPGLVPQEDLDQLVEFIHCNSDGASRAATGAAASNLDLYQINCTFFDALGRDEAAYLMARAVQFFVPGVPQVYYVGLLAGQNDLALLNETGTGRDINRHHFRLNELNFALDLPVVKDLVRLIRLRNEHPAFAGEFSSSCPMTATGCAMRFEWLHDSHWTRLHVDFAERSTIVEWSSVLGTQRWSIGGKVQALENAR